MQFPAAALTLAASACLVFAYHCARLSGTSAVWLSSFAALMTFLAQLPRILQTKAPVCHSPHDKSRLLSVVACAIFCLSATYGLAELGALRFACACACATGVNQIARTQRRSRNAKLACTLLSCVILALTSDPGRQTRSIIPFSVFGVLCTTCGVYFSTKDVVKKADQTAFLFAACGLSAVGFIATLLEKKPIVENEMLLLLVFCISGLVLAGCISAGLTLQGSAINFVSGAAGLSVASLVCGEKVFPIVYDWESLALLASIGLIFIAHKGLAFADLPVTSPNSFSLTSMQMLKTNQYREGRGVMFTLFSNSRERRLFVFLLLTLSIMLLEFIYGLAVNSLGLISDSFHMMLDGASIVIGLYAAYAASWLPDEKTHPFGYARYEIFGGFINGILLLFISLYVMVESVQRFVDPPEIEGPYLLLVSVIGLAVNVVGVIFFHDSHGHSHSHSHGNACSGHVDHNMRGVYLHILADLLGSVSVIISSTLIYMFGFWIADPICSALSAILVLLSAFPLLEETGKVLLLSAPNHQSNYSDKLREALLATSLLQDIESAKLWIHSTPPRELIICTVSGKLRNNVVYTSARKQITEAATTHLMHHLDVQNISFVLHLE
ncbi:cation transporter, putative [Leishmania tarentolae]|uniref:Cation transporter, putative n=1 Tax=Leishmania tarentolae TaxID=5689 RepID=A0A640KJ73_LEITA|nr:cation transporter, putative [Leishmania tarentolae]